nr:MAG TPA: Protein of unknown function (DUF1642) [Caudoviricetes sp.]
MNKEELIKKIEALPAHNARINKGIVLDLVEQLDEPQPVKLPPFVADWYEENKDDFEGNLYRCAYNTPSAFDSAKLNEFERWFLTAGTKPFQTLVNMHQFGYEVDEEKRYLVKIKASNQYIMSNPDENAIFFYSCRAYSKLTRKELEEAGFGWVFSCEGIEIEEVE